MNNTKLPLLPKELISLRRLLAFSGTVYLVWWFAVEALLPDSFNPFLGRILVVAGFFVALGLSYVNQWVQNHLRFLMGVCLWILTLHYFYLFYNNHGGMDWIIGCYITVLAICFYFLSNTSLLSYTGFVIVLSTVIVFMIPSLQKSVFLPGLVTILIQANIGMRARLNLIQTRALAANMSENVRIRDEFISIASHELKTPISTLKLQTQLIERDIKKSAQPYTPEKLTQTVALLNRQVDRLFELVETMLDVSRISAGRLTLDKEVIHLPEIIQEIVTGLQMENLVTIHAPKDLTINADRIRMSQVILNLVTNAKKYGNEKPVQIKLESNKSQVILTVEDQGLGIAPEFIDRIFNRFERAISAQHISGLGLGLYISKQIIDAHNGTIKVESELGIGSRFTVILPRPH